MTTYVLVRDVESGVRKIYINGELAITQKGRGDNIHLNTRPVEFLKTNVS